LSPRRKIWTWVLGVTGLLAGNSFSSNLEIRASLGYDFVSQEYFLDSVITDTTLSIWQLESSYLDDFKGRLAIHYRPFDDRRLELQTSYEQSSELYRFRSQSDWHPRFGNSRFDLSTEIERRGRHRGENEFGDSYYFGYTRAALTTSVSEKTNLKFQLSGEFVSFDSAADFNYNYYRLGPKFGISRIFEGFSFLDANFYFVSRQVPDSSELDYLSFGIEGSFLGIMEGGDIDLYSRLERKNYNRTDVQDDHFRVDFDGRGKIKMGAKYFTQFELQTEIVLYNRQDPLNFDYGRTGWAILAGIENNGWSVGAGPTFELLMEQEGTYNAAEDYFEMGGKVEIEVLKAGRIFGSIESILGYRNLSVEEQFYTDFVFQRLNTLGNITLVQGLNLNWLFSAEWEWHDLQQDNSQIFLLSTNLTYSI